MKVIPLNIPDLLVIEPTIFTDDRGIFFESFNLNDFKRLIFQDVSFVQDNHTKSFQNVLRGLHYQLPPYAQGKLVRVLQGEILDVAVDIRKSSSTFGMHASQFLSAENRKQIWIPEGFAHGYITVSKTSEVSYKTTRYYNPKYEQCILWNDSTLNIDWGDCMKPQISPKDFLGKNFLDASYFL